MRLIKRKLFTPTIPVIRIDQTITPRLAQRFLKNLKLVDRDTAVAIAVNVNSKGGYPAQSQIIATKLRSFADDRGLKLYTFAADQATSGGYAILSVGDEVYADRVSLVGSIGVVWKKYQLAGLYEAAHIKQQIIQSQRTMMKIAQPFIPMQQSDREVIKQLSDANHRKFIEFVKHYRGNKLNKQKYDKIFDGGAVTGEQAVAYGLVDGIGNMTQVMAKKYPNAKLSYPKMKGFYQRMFWTMIPN